MDSKKRTEPVAIITSGGGMKCSYSAGAVYALATKLGITDPDVFISASGSVGAMFYYLAGQQTQIRQIWTRYLPTRAFIKYAPFPSMSIDYLVDTVFKDFFPLNTDALAESSTRYFVPITDAETGDVRYVSNETWFDPYEVMRAAKAVPILYNGHVRLGARKYFDGDFSTSLAALIKKAVDVGATRIICMTNSPEPDPLVTAALHAYAFTLRPALRRALVADLRNHEEIVLPEGARFVCLSPTAPLPAGVFTRDRRRVIETFSMGYDDLLAKRDEVEALFRD